MTVMVQFTMEPDEPDDDHATGMSNDEFEDMTNLLMERLGAEDIEVTKVEP